jgi:hypothetical protein
LVIATAGLLRRAADPRGEGPHNYRVFHKAVQGAQKVATDQRLWLHLLRRKGGYTVALAPSLR